MNLKEPIKIRFKKLKNGSLSLYLDFYFNGKRKYEFLKLYLTNGKTKEQKQIDKLTLKTAQTIKYKRIIKLLANQTEKFNSQKETNITLVECCKKIYKQKEIEGNGKSNIFIYKAITKHLQNFSNNTLITNVDKKFIIDFIDYLKNKNLSQNTIYTYFCTLKTIFTECIRQKFITQNPISQLSRKEIPKLKKSLPKYLTTDELATLKKNKCPNEEVKRAFLFSCLTGLRFSDIKTITYSNLRFEKEDIHFQKEIVKTHAIVSALLPKPAVELLEKNKSGLIFNLPSLPVVEKNLKKWSENTNIGKKITFHSARHTFATTLLTQGADLYTVSKLLGHSNITTTQIYAKIIDSKKDETISLLNHII